LKPAPARLILDLVRGCRNFALGGFAALFTQLASGADYTVHIPASPGVRIVWSVGYTPAVSSPSQNGSGLLQSAGWDVAVSFDAAKCGITCTYRRKRNAMAGFLPPVATIQIFTGGSAKPETVLVDPAGLTIPDWARHSLAPPDQPCLPGRRFLAAGLVHSARAAAPRPPQAHFMPPAYAAASSSAPYPLRT
jgi:hypothetical protein